MNHELLLIYRQVTEQQRTSAEYVGDQLANCTTCRRAAPRASTLPTPSRRSHCQSTKASTLSILHRHPRCLTVPCPAKRK
ncbi:hypothetical protein KPH14_008888 [Odynerus spinipes]|uniref:Uncharacterized protein n=1 Tax=Odynerus spinipes TaxID=1348599 RepID=A0AAD9RG13_9HYME|nr:hypothetical protein KPH14_008888 [Odynerus spinipes]